MNHYEYLEKHLKNFFEKLGLRYPAGIITAHGDKGYCYKDLWQANGLDFSRGMAIYLLSYCHPYSKESRETENGWVPVEQWVIDNKDRFLSHLP